MGEEVLMEEGDRGLISSDLRIWTRQTRYCAACEPPPRPLRPPLSECPSDKRWVMTPTKNETALHVLVKIRMAGLVNGMDGARGPVVVCAHGLAWSS